MLAAVALEPGASADPEERLAAYAYPREIRIVDELPKGTTGKILKKELRGLSRCAATPVTIR